MTVDDILESTARYYGEKISQHGATAKGVDWNSTDSQWARFEQLLKVSKSEEALSINDYGCGYGALIEYLVSQGRTITSYCGFDISGPMLGRAQNLHPNLPQCRFVGNESDIALADYTVASGIFNVRLETSDQDWQDYILHTLGIINRLSAKGFAFNLLTSYSDPERMRPDLFYADPLWLFDYCKRNFSKYVSLLHDYPLYEFTILVRKH